MIFINENMKNAIDSYCESTQDGQTIYRLVEDWQGEFSGDFFGGLSSQELDWLYDKALVMHRYITTRGKSGKDGVSEAGQLLTVLYTLLVQKESKNISDPAEQDIIAALAKLVNPSMQFVAVLKSMTFERLSRQGLLRITHPSSFTNQCCVVAPTENARKIGWDESNIDEKIWEFIDLDLQDDN